MTQNVIKHILTTANIDHVFSVSDAHPEPAILDPTTDEEIDGMAIVCFPGFQCSQVQPLKKKFLKVGGI